MRIQCPELSGEITRDWILDGNGKWELNENKLVLYQAGKPGGPIRRPAALALLAGLEKTDFEISLEFRSTMDPGLNRADIVLVFGYQSPSRFYYAHLSGVTDAVHNGIFIVNEADRRRIDAGNGDPTLTDRNWHRVRLNREGESGRIRVFMDDAENSALDAVDISLRNGLVGIGSFDDTAEFRNISVLEPGD